MTEASLISSVALRVDGCKKAACGEGWRPVLAGLKIEIRTKLNLMGATKIFRIFSDNRSALNAYKWQVERNSNGSCNISAIFEIVPPAS